MKINLASRRWGWKIIISFLILLQVSSSKFPLAGDPSQKVKPQPLPTTWAAFANQGLNGDVYSMLLVGDDLYVGGSFTQTADGMVTNLNAIARYNLTANTWNALARDGLTEPLNPSPQVRAMALVGTTLYVGGYFDRTGDGMVTGLNHIARYDIVAGTWSALANNGLGAGVLAILPVGLNLFVGGAFNSSYDGMVTNLNAIARYNIVANTWSSLANNGLTGPLPSVSELVLLGNDLYVGGHFDQTADASITLNEIACYHLLANTWSPLANNGLDGDVRGLALVGSDLFVGGPFTRTDDGTIDLIHVARYNTSMNTWSPLAHNGLNNGATVSEIIAIGNDVYIGGYVMNQTNDGAVTNLNNIAYYNAAMNTWSPVPNNGLSDGGGWAPVFALENGVGEIYVGGEFSQTHDGAVTNLNNIARLGGDLPPQVISVLPSGMVSGSVTQIRFTFSEDVNDPPGDINPDDVTNPANYLLVQPGLNGSFDTLSCIGPAGDDILVPDGLVTYTSIGFGAIVTVNGGTRLAEGEYRGFVCGTTSIIDSFANRLGGGVDYIYNFTVVAPQALPETGFPPQHVTQLARQPLENAYTELGDLWLEIPSLGIKAPIVGVPQMETGWDVRWLGNEIGWLQGTAFPTLQGNTGLAGHVYDAYGQPGPFMNLGKLYWGQTIFIHAWGQQYIYEVRSVSRWARPDDLRFLKHEEYDWITLITCRGYDEHHDTYRWRTVVRAVLVEVAADP